MKFTGHERDLGNLSSAADDLDYMHARFYNPQTGRFLSTDPRPQRRSLTSSQFWNRYGYSAGNPLKYVDPNGKCAVPAGLKEGQVGICIEAFIAAGRIAGIGFGDNRDFQENDPNGTARISYKSIIDPQSGAIVKETTQAGVTKAGLTEGLSVGKQGTVDAVGGSATTPEGTRFSIYLSGKNGFAAINRLGSIGVLADFTVDRSGGVGVNSNSRTKGYPSIEGYAYRIVQGELVIQVLFKVPEEDPSQLDEPMDTPLAQ
jgi:RHS repeat-associated protein